MNYTTFNATLYHLLSFDTIGYNKEQRLLKIIFFNGCDKVYVNVPENDVFAFILAEDKENFYKAKIQDIYEETGSLSS